MPRKREPHGYLIPDTLEPTENICICVPVPNDRGHIRAFLGQMYQLTRWWTWERDAAQSGAILGRVWLDIYECISAEVEAIMTNGCGCGCNDEPLKEQMLPDGSLEVSEDGGATWRPAERNEDPRTNGSLNRVPEDAGTDEGKCAAANSFVSSIENTINEMIAKKTTGALAADIVAIVIALLVAFGVIATGGALAVFGAALGAIVASYTLEEFEDAFTSAVYSDLLCRVYCYLNAEAFISQDQALTLAAEFKAANPGIAGNTIGDLIIAMGEVGCTNAARSGLGGTRECDACECGEWCYYFDFATGMHDWLINTDPVDFGRYTASVGFQQNLDFDPVDAIEIYRLFPTRTVTSLTIYVDPTFTGGAPRTILYLGDYTADDITHDGAYDSHEFTFSESLARLSLDVDPYAGAAGEWTGAIVAIKMTGLGSNPFGTDNCP